MASYNIALAGFHLAKGTILQYNSITIGDGPLPAAIAERAADHFAARQAGLKVRERPAPPAHGPAALPATLGGVPAGAPLPEAAGTPRVDPDAPPPVADPLVLPPKDMPKDVLPAPPRELKPTPDKTPKDKEPKPITAPGPLPGLPVSEAPVSGPTLPVSATEAADGPAMPATPVSRFRPK